MQSSLADGKMVARFRSALMPEVKAAERAASVAVKRTMDQVLVQCSSIRTPEARVVLKNMRPSKTCPDEECKYGRRRTLVLCQDEPSGLAPLEIPAPV